MDQEKMEPSAIKWDSLAYGSCLAASLTAPALEQSVAYVPKPVSSAFWDMLLYEECIWCRLQIWEMAAALKGVLEKEKSCRTECNRICPQMQLHGWNIPFFFMLTVHQVLDFSKTTPTWDPLDYTTSSNKMCRSVSDAEFSPFF